MARNDVPIGEFSNPSRRVIVRLKILDFKEDPATVGKLLGLTASTSWSKGDAVVEGQPSRLRKQNGWVLDSPSPTDSEVEESVSSLLRLLPELGVLERLPEGSRMELAIGVTGYSERPAIHFSATSLRRMAVLGADVDIDVYDLTE